VSETLNCWQCGQPTAGLLFCPACNSLQRPPSDYYRLFGIPRKLQLDTDDLQRRFYDLSRQLHPDRFTRKPEREREYSLDASSLLNDAWRALRDRVSRAEYLLKQEGFDIGEQRSQDVPPELLEEVFELNMALEEMRGGDEAARPHLATAGHNFEEMLSTVDTQLDERFADWDASGDRDKLTEIRALLNRRRYIQNLVTQVNETLTEPRP
jgi:molecular chaperone HscB